MKSNDLIEHLVSELKPVKVLRFSFIDFLKVILVGIGAVLAAVLTLGLRSNFQEVLSVRFVLECVGLLIWGVLSTQAAFYLSVPSREPRKFYQRPSVVVPFLLGFALFSFFASPAPFHNSGNGFACAVEILLISSLPTAVLFYLVRRAAPLKRDLLGASVLSAGLSFGLLGVHFACFDHTPLHLLLWHILPAAMIIGVGVFIARRFLRKI